MSNEFIEIPVNKQSLGGRKLVFDQGINDATYQVQPIIDGKTYKCPYYLVWICMLQRCYSKELHNRLPSYQECSVCNDWIIFSNFKAWMETQDWKGKQLDKDILIKGNKLYSPETCIFIPNHINCLLLDQKTRRGKYLLGVSWYKPYSKYRSQYSNGIKNITLGYFNTEKEAHEAYCKAKAEYIIEVANQQTDVRIKSALLLRASEIHLQE